jgi:hypothetical protein
MFQNAKRLEAMSQNGWVGTLSSLGCLEWVVASHLADCTLGSPQVSTLEAMCCSPTATNEHHVFTAKTVLHLVPSSPAHDKLRANCSIQANAEHFAIQARTFPPDQETTESSWDTFSATLP